MILSMMMMMIMSTAVTMNIDHPMATNSLLINNNQQLQKKQQQQSINRMNLVQQSFPEWQRNSESSTTKSTTTWNCCLWMAKTNMVVHFDNPNCQCFLEFTDLPLPIVNSIHQLIVSNNNR